MKVSQVVPRAGYLVVEVVPEERTSESGIILKENEDSFVVVGTVVAADPEQEFPVGTKVIYHTLDAQLGFLDVAKEYAFVKQEKVVGTIAE